MEGFQTSNVKTYQERRSAARDICRGLILRKVEPEVRRQVIIPLGQFRVQSRELLDGNLVSSRCRIDLFENLGKDAGAAEESQCAAETSGLAREGRLEALFSNVFIIRIHRILSMDVILLQQLGKAEDGSRETT